MPDEEIVLTEEQKAEAAKGKVEPKAETEEEKTEREEAIRLYRALNGDKGVTILSMLAREAGIKLADESTTKTEKKDAIMDMLEEHLGSQYKFLAPKLGPVLKGLLEESKRETAAEIAKINSRDLERTTDLALTEIMAENKDFHLFTKQIEELMKEISPAPNTSQKAYLTRLYKLAKADAQSESSETSRAERLRRATRDISRVPPLGGSDKSHKNDNARPTLRQAISETLDDLVTSESDK